MKLAKPRHRIMATFLDYVIFSTFTMFFFITKISYFFKAIFSPSVLIEGRIILDMFRVGVLSMILIILYFVAIPYFLNGQTLGKKVFRLQILNENNAKPTISELFLREVIGKIFIDFLSLGLATFVSLVIMINREDFKSLSDIIAKTKVIDLYIEE